MVHRWMNYRHAVLLIVIVLQQLNELIVVSALCKNDRQRLRTARLSLIASHLIFYQDQESAEHLDILDISRGFRVLDRFTAPNSHYLFISDVPSASLVTSPALMLLNFIYRSQPITLSLSIVSVALTEADFCSLLSMLYELDDLRLYDLGWCPCKLLTHRPQTGSWNPFLTKLIIPLCPDAVDMVNSRSHDDYNKKLKFPVKRLRCVDFKAPYPDGAADLVRRMSGAVERGVKITSGPYEEVSAMDNGSNV